MSDHGVGRLRRGEYVGLVGDIVHSRRTGNRAALQLEIDRALEDAARDVAAVRPPMPTVGDEFQGLYWTVNDALAGACLIRLRLKDVADVRFGIGSGPLTYFAGSARQERQDGPAWWAAREAIEQAKRLQHSRSGPRWRRTVFLRYIGPDRPRSTASWSGQMPGQQQLPGLESELPDPAPLEFRTSVDAFVDSLLVCCDEIIGRMDGRDARIALDLIHGVPSAVTATREGISESAVSQRRKRKGCYVVREVVENLRHAR